MEKWLDIDPRTTTSDDFPSEGSTQEQIAFLLTFAVRAPSTHNTQPWRFAIEDDTITFFPDMQKTLPQGDPQNHYLYISIGMLVESFVIAAQYFGFSTVIESSNRDIICVSVAGPHTRSNDTALFEALTKRRNPRGAFEDGIIPDNVLELVCSEARSISEHIVCTAITDDLQRAHIAEETGVGVARAHTNPAFRKEISSWMKNSLFPGKEGIPGFTLGMPILLSFIVPTVIRFINMGKVLGKKSAEAVRTAPTAFVFGTTNENPHGFIELGRSIQRTMLYLQSKKYTTSIFVGAIEGGNVQLSKEVHDGSIHFIFVAGKLIDPQVPWKFAPRHAVGDKLI